MAAVAAVGGLAGCAAVMGLLLALRIGVSVALPWWVAVVAPVVVYGGVAFLSLSRLSPGRKALAFGGVVVAHATVVLAGGLVSASASGLTLEEGLLEAGARFLPAPLFLLCAVPLALMPLRPLLGGDRGGRGQQARARRGEAWSSGARPEAVPGWYVWPREESPSAESAGGGSLSSSADISHEGAAEPSRVMPPAPVTPPPPVLEREPVPGMESAWRPEPPPATPGPVLPAPSVASLQRVEPAPAGPGPLPSGAAGAAAAMPPGLAWASENARSPLVAAPAGPAAPAHLDDMARPTGLSRSPEPLIEAACGRGADESDPAGSAPDRDAGCREMMVVAFEPIAAQLPSDAFSIPLERLGAALLEPGRLLVPRDIILSQLAEGEVTVAWDEVADQFPAHAFVVPKHAVGTRLPHGRLVLPLAELFTQLPPDVFALGSAEVDVSGIQTFALPFQPEAPPPAEAEPVPTTTGHAASAVRPAATPAAMTPADEPRAAAPPEGPAGLVTSEAPGAVAAGDGPAAVRGRPAPVPGAGQETEAIVGSAIDEVAGERSPQGPAASWLDQPLRAEPVPEPPVALADVSKTRAVEDVPEAGAREAALDSAPGMLASLGTEGPGPVDPVAEAGRGHRGGDRRAIRLLAERLAPAGALEADLLTIDGVRLHTFLAPTLPGETVLTLTAKVLRLLEPGRAPWPVDQLTLRLEDAAVVFTPLAPARGGRSVLVGAIPRGGSLAMLEILSRQASAESLPVSNGRPIAVPAVRDEDDDTPLHQVSAGVPQRQVAGLLGGLGRLVPTVFRGGADGIELNLFLDADEEALPVARYGHHVCRALSTDEVPAGLGPVRSAVARTGDRRLVLMPVDGPPGRWTALLTAAAEPARPGLVRLHVERAAARLAAS